MNHPAFKEYVNPRNGKQSIHGCVVCGAIKLASKDIKCDASRRNPFKVQGWKVKK